MPKDTKTLMAILERGGIGYAAAKELAAYSASDGGDKISGEVVSSVLSANYAAVGATPTAVTGWQVVVPANSGPCNIGVVGGVPIQVVTGTNASTVSQAVFVRLVDELSNVVAYAGWTLYGTGTSQTLFNTLAIGTALAAQSIDKTYHMEFSHSANGTLGASATIAAASPFPNLTLQAYRR